MTFQKQKTSSLRWNPSKVVTPSVMTLDVLQLPSATYCKFKAHMLGDKKIK